MNKYCFKLFPEFQTERLFIRAFAETDFDAYVTWYCDDILYYMQGLHYINKDDIDGFKRLFLKNVPRMFKTKESIVWCVSDKNTDECIGKIEMCKFDMNCNSAQIHYCLSKIERGKGYITEAIKKVIEWAFNVLDLNRLYTYVWEENNASSNVLIKCNFKLEGILRESSLNKYTINGEKIKNTAKNNVFIGEKEYKNEQIYSIFKNEYLQTK